MAEIVGLLIAAREFLVQSCMSSSSSGPIFAKSVLEATHFFLFYTSIVKVL